jgi:uncharacterized protein (DUF4415 family)
MYIGCSSFSTKPSATTNVKRPSSRKPLTDADGEVRPMTEEDFEAATYHPGTKARPKQVLHIRLDADVVDYFKAQGPGYQTRINHVLATYVQAGKRRGRQA